jgi:hypothetical protein
MNRVLDIVRKSSLIAGRKRNVSNEFLNGALIQTGRVCDVCSLNLKKEHSIKFYCRMALKRNGLNLKD